MIHGISRLGCICAVAALGTGAWAQFNGLYAAPRVYNDFSTSTLTITNSNSIPGNVMIDDRNLVDDGIGGNFANRHDILLSTDNGVSGYVGTIGTAFTIQATLMLSAGANSPRKEAGFRINSGTTGDALFIVNSDAGEIVAFGGGAPFKLFGKNADGNGYTPGTSILMGMTYTPGAVGTIEYFINRGAGLETSGPLNWSNTEGGPVDYTVGMYLQLSPANSSDFATAEFTNVTAAVPEPASMAALGLGVVAFLRRRSK